MLTSGWRQLRTPAPVQLSDVRRWRRAVADGPRRTALRVWCRWLMRRSHQVGSRAGRRSSSDAGRFKGVRSAMAVEQPSFKLLVRDGAFEVREYGPRAVAEVQASGAQTHAAGQGFRVLASYIFGANERRRSIAMTAPVDLVRNGPGWIVRFTLPQSLSASEAPRPTDRRVKISEAPRARFATLRFSGLATEAEAAKRIRQLDGWIADRRLKPSGSPTLAQYDPPWTLWFLRHNEILQPLAG